MAKLVLVCISILTVAVQSFATRPLGEAYKDSASGDSLNTVENLCALVPNSTTGSVAKLCHDLAGVAVGLDESIYCGHEVFNETEEMSAPPEPSFTMREIVGSNTSEQAYNAVVDRCTNQSASSARRQMAVWGNYGWCSIETGFLVSKLTNLPLFADSANYCDTTTSEANWGRGTSTSRCCAEHDKCLTCNPTRTCGGSSSTGSSCDRELASCALKLPCFSVVFSWSWTFGSGGRNVNEPGAMGMPRVRVFIRFDFDCLAVAAAIAVYMSGITPNRFHYCEPNHVIG